MKISPAINKYLYITGFDNKTNKKKQVDRN